MTEREDVEFRMLPRLRLAEALARYRIDGPIDDAGDRAIWQADAVRDVVGNRAHDERSG